MCISLCVCVLIDAYSSLSMNIRFISLQAPINPYGKAKKMAEEIILDFSKDSKMAVMILRLWNLLLAIQFMFITFIEFLLNDSSEQAIWFLNVLKIV